MGPKEPKEKINFEGICGELQILTGIRFKFVLFSEGKRLLLCDEKDFCKSTDFPKQSKKCRHIEKELVQKMDRSQFECLNIFPCGLVEFVLPVIQRGKLHGVILSNKIKIKKGASADNIQGRRLDMFSQQVSSLKVLLNRQAALFADHVAIKQNFSAESRDNILVDRARNIINKDFHNSSLTLTSLCREIGTSYFHLCRLFKKETKITFVRHLTFVRMKAALDLLRNRRLTVAQVAYAAGFSDPQYFDRVFKKWLGCSPTGYRSGSSLKREAVKKKLLSCLEKS